MFELKDFEAIRIGLASPEKIREWSRGEVKKPETINYRTLKPERDGLFCERIFGPTKDWECHCGKYKRIRYKGIVCDRCGVEVTRSKVRRERMGHIELAAPVSHIWYFKGIPSRMGLLLDMSPRALEKVLYFAAYVVIDPGTTPLSKKQILSEKEYRDSLEKFGNNFRAGMGAEAIKELLQEIDLDALAEELRAEIEESTGQKRIRAIKRLEVVEAFRQSGNKPEWMILDVIPVIPPELRPMVQLDGGRFATSDLNDLYRRVINRNNRLKKLLDLGAPEIIVRNEKRMLQEAVDALIDNGRRGRPVTGPGNRPLKSLSDMLKGKQGRFRQNLLGKRVDYSGRSVIVVGPELKLWQCGLPKEMALELFKPFVMKRLVEKGLAHNIKSAKRMVERVRTEVWDVLEEVIKEHPVLLNRAPTLHRLGIQAFEPVLVEGRAIQLHPLVCTAYNADFDGDQMAVHVPLSAEAQAEARFLMLSANNLLKPQDGKPVTVPTQDMVLGSYYLTVEKENDKGEGKAFSSPEEAIMAYENGYVSLHAKIKVKMTRMVDGVKKSKVIETTVGKLIFNEAIPQNLGFVDRTNPETMFNLEVDFLVGKKELSRIIERCIKVNGTHKTALVLDEIKRLGFKYSTKGAITIGISDMIIPEIKQRYLEETDKKIELITKQYRRGLITDEERRNAVINAWNKTTEDVKNALIASMDKFNPVFMMSNSGARGNINQIRQLAGMRGLMADTAGKTIEIPIRSNFREGLNVLEYFISTHGARKGLADTALRTADSGYLTRRLVDVSQDVIVREEDCHTEDGITVTDIVSSGEKIESLEERITGRYAAEDIIDPETKEVLVRHHEMIDSDMAQLIVSKGINKVKIRSVLTCRTRNGVCAKCYGLNLATGEPVNVGEAVGIIAAQSIGEPGTQLTMRTFHTGGVAGEDITQGLPRVEELFEARKPKGLAIITEISGVVTIKDTKKKREVIVTNESGEAQTYLIPYGSRLKVSDGQRVEAGDELTEGSVNPHDILKIKGIEAVQSYLLSEVQKVYRLQGVDINDKHIEIIIRQMMKKVKVEESGDTRLLPGSLVDMFEFEDENAKAIAEGKRPAEGKRALLGITKAALATDSFLSAASFQETTRVLTEAAIKGKTDPLLGLKENVIIGKLIPAGTGMNRYRDIEIEAGASDTAENSEETQLEKL
ncbi:DNA-directed RNA polymerase subunit beta' [Thermoclostridium stercorarium subsp. stercorarium DSM 8532]|uniref:DNA-directed RNA polymerase subunit beta' n=2 Tax=Thermoclostridium stercorarium TaxID=1510 RepID=L7VKP4_THES1|nr:DNA-directed RNA polymerase subunit beta' [Thermoclostridium stercorarium]AGC67322.1 DNA-directed RNA polymerase subunit beta' [Thermoclostridium stercorarium subsp. stercorarium DSM 8532]AGI38384.1 DNA-directed RNA polymerase beta subunit [Thermoclostridium stercorarium subsp. stercorarium DSM 8532]ANX00346.1 DNA-directed RNA polymerase subunit beta' [Thermoclostridium stercorarium subsp. leptospartum DSM 9219]UZQ85893.1 DNA-directed RNA polymerase subunit beta' [Thermoclostridium stercorar